MNRILVVATKWKFLRTRSRYACEVTDQINKWLENLESSGRNVNHIDILTDDYGTPRYLVFYYDENPSKDTAGEFKHDR